MKRTFKRKNKIGVLWIIAWSVIYAAFLALGAIKATDLYATILKYVGLILCFLYVLVHSRKDVYLLLALLLTLVADGILIFNNVSLLGVAVFILVQTMHLFRFTQIRATSPLLPILAVAVIIVVGLLQNEIPIMFVFAIAYAVLMFTNIFEAAKWHAVERSRVSLYALIGFILFLLCDICVGVSYVTTTETLPHMITMAMNYTAWAFYLPAQIFIALSGKREADFEEVAALSEADLNARTETL